MATYKHIRSATANKRPTTSIADGQLAINTNTASPGLFFKDSAGTGIVKVGPVHVGTTAPNSTPAAGGSSGNYLGEQWLDTSVSPAQMKIWNGSAWVGIVADELPVSKLQDGAARQLIQTDAAGTGVEWTSNIDVPGTLDVTGASTLDSTLSVAGVSSFASGSAAAPSLTFTGDTNTGIYRPGADQVAISTNGTGRLFIDASGNVGIGRTALTGQAIAAQGVKGITSLTSSTGTNGVYHYFQNTGGTFYLGLDSSTGSDFGATYAGAIYHYGNYPIVFGTNGTERMRLDSSGRLGLGTSSPGTILDARGIVSIGSANNSNAVIQKSAVPVGSFNLTITSGGGLTSESAATPTDALAGSVIKLLGGDPTTDTFGGGIQYYANGSTSPNGAGVGNQHVFYTRSAANTYTERLRIDAAGRVGVGSTPKRTLHVFGEAALSNTANTGSFLVVPGSNGATVNYLYSRTAENTITALPFALAVGSQEALRVDTNARLLVGTSSSPSAGEGQYARIVAQGYTGGVTGGGYISLQRGEAATAITAEEELGLINFGDSAGNTFGTIACRADATAGSGDFPGRIVLSTTADGAASPTETLRITNDRVIAYNQGAPAAVNATATLTVANLKTGIITSTSAAATDMTLPTGTLTEGGFSGIYTNMTFEWSVINTGPSLVRVLAGTDHTIVGSGSVATGTSGRFASRRTAANTFVTYRLS